MLGKTIRREEALDNFTRGMIYGFIAADPGVHYNAIKKELGLNNGALLYHLEMLERKSYIWSEKDGTKKRFYTSGTPAVQFVDQNDAEIIEYVEGHPGCHQKSIADMLGMSARKVHYCIRRLAKSSALRTERDGRIVKCFASS